LALVSTFGFPRGARYRLHQRYLQVYAFRGGSQADAERGVSQRFILKENQAFYLVVAAL